MLRPKGALRPAEARLELDSEEVSYLPVNAVAYASLQLALRIADLKSSLQRNRIVYLHAGAGERNVFQIGNRTPDSPVLVLPSDVYEIGTQHPRFNSAVLHMFLLSACHCKRISGIWALNHLTPV
jgi:hypothetical protein